MFKKWLRREGVEFEEEADDTDTNIVVMSTPHSSAVISFREDGSLSGVGSRG